MRTPSRDPCPPPASASPRESVLNSPKRDRREAETVFRRREASGEKLTIAASKAVTPVESGARRIESRKASPSPLSTSTRALSFINTPPPSPSKKRVSSRVDGEPPAGDGESVVGSVGSTAKKSKRSKARAAGREEQGPTTIGLLLAVCLCLALVLAVHLERGGGQLKGHDVQAQTDSLSPAPPVAAVQPRGPLQTPSAEAGVAKSAGTGTAPLARLAKLLRAPLAALRWAWRTLLALLLGGRRGQTS